MTPKEFQIAYPHVTRWIRQTLFVHASDAQAVASIGFKRIPRYFSCKLLTSAKFVYVERVPVPPLSAIGLSRFAAFERGDFDGITYLNTIFIKNLRADDEQVHFHELIHVVQWRLLGPERFLAAYVSGLENYGYCNNPFEVMAYNAEVEFCRNARPFDAEKFVEEEISRIDPPQFRLGESLQCQKTLPPIGRVDSPKALVASRQAVAECRVEGLSDQPAAHGVQAGQPCLTDPFASDRESPFMKAACGKTARAV